MKKFKTITVADSERLIAERHLILDCRDLKDYKAGHIENAMHMHEQLRDSLLIKAKNTALVDLLLPRPCQRARGGDVRRFRLSAGL